MVGAVGNLSPKEGSGASLPARYDERESFDRQQGHQPTCLAIFVDVTVEWRAFLVRYSSSICSSALPCPGMPAGDDVGFVAFAQQAGPGRARKPVQPGECRHQAHGVPGQRFLADAGALAPSNLVAKAGLPGLMGCRPSEHVVQVVAFNQLASTEWASLLFLYRP